MTAQFDMVDMLLVPLTPIHVGGGEEAMLRPETYRIAEDALELFAPARVLADLPEGERRQLVAALARDSLVTMDRVRNRVRADHVAERIAAAPDSLKELRRALSPAADRGQQRSGEVNAFQRAGDGPLIPGSSIKGALRTAWLARETATLALAAIPPGVFGDGARFEAIRRSEPADNLMRRGFGLESGKDLTDADPFRDVVVSDAALPSGATRIDPVKSWKRTGDAYDFPRKSPQMHWERTMSAIDGGSPPLIPLSLGVRTAAVRAGRPRGAKDAKGAKGLKAPAHSPDSVGALLAALEGHHAPLWRREAEETFFAGAPGERLRAALALMKHLDRSGADPAAALVRLGRGAHAESKSVARFRTVHRPQARKSGGREFAAEGSTRHVIDICGRPAPFGWALLVRADRWRPPSTWLGAAPAARGQASRPEPAAVQTGPLYRAGQRVTVGGEPATIISDVRHGDAEAHVRFSYGPEWVAVSDID